MHKQAQEREGESVREPEIVLEATAGGNRKPTCCSRGAKCIWQHCQHGQHLNELEARQRERAGRQAAARQLVKSISQRSFQFPSESRNLLDIFISAAAATNTLPAGR